MKRKETTPFLHKDQMFFFEKELNILIEMLNTSRKMSLYSQSEALLLKEVNTRITLLSQQYKICATVVFQIITKRVNFVY